MTSVQHLRDFIRDRLAAAAEDIFSAFERTIEEYEEKLQEKLGLQITWSPTVKHHRTDLPEQHTCTQQEVLAAPQLCDQERTSSPEQENPEPPRVKEEQEELCSGREGEPPVPKQEVETVMVTLVESNHSDPEPGSDELLSNSSHTVVFVDSTSKELLEVINESVQDEVEIDHQCRVLSHTWNPLVKLYRTDFPQQHVREQKEVLTDQQLCDQERTSSPEQENPESPQVKEEQEEVCSSREGEVLVQKQEADMVQPCLGPPAPVEPITAPFNVSDLSADSYLTLKRITLTGGKLYLCNTCGKIFTTMYSFKRHNTIHTGERPFVCNTCGRGFRQVYHLTVHRRRHTGELPYVCDTCGKRFKYKVQMRRHMRVHTGERPHVCNTCGKNFKDKGPLRAHMRVHTKELMQVCSTCGKRYKTATTLKRHMQKHTTAS